MSNQALPAGLSVYLINLDRAVDRLARMTAKCDAVGLPFELVPAVDGSTLSFPHPAFDAWGYRYLHGRRVIPAEVGCYLSHVACAQRLLDSQDTHALILEDDVAFPSDFTAILRAAMAEDDSWDILRLSTMNTGRKFGFRDLPGGRRLAKAFTREKGAGAYVINRAAARWITGRLMPMRLSYDIAFDLEYLAGLRAVFVDPPPVDQRDEPASQIQMNLRASKYPATRYLTVLPYRAWLEISRLVARSGQYVYARAHYLPYKTVLKVASFVLAITLGIDEIFDNM